MKPNDFRFDIAFKKTLKDVGMTQSEVCQKTGISKKVMSDYANGKIVPTIGRAWEIAQAIGCTLDDLVCVGDEPGSWPLAVRRTLDVSGLSDSDIGILEDMVDRFRS